MLTKLIGKSETGIESYLLDNGGGMKAQIITYGARVQKLFVPDRSGRLIDVVAGFENVEEYRDDRGTYFGATVGRVANRIGGAEFVLDGKKYELFKNDGNNHLHGGREGFDKKLWTVETLDEASIRLGYLSSDGEEGYPGNLRISVTYTLSKDNALEIAYETSCDKNTLCSLTNHSYFNLDGDFKSALNHMIYINSDAVTNVNEELIPTGEIIKVKNTPFDFSSAKPLGRDIHSDDILLKNARGGYDINYVLNNVGDDAVAVAYSPDSGIEMSVYTDRPCMQLYSGNFLDGFSGKTSYPYQSAFCMETQGYPNACNIDNFESIRLNSGDVYKTHTIYAFSGK